MEVGKLILKFKQKCKQARIARKILKKQRTERRISPTKL